MARVFCNSVTFVVVVGALFPHIGWCCGARAGLRNAVSVGMGSVTDMSGSAMEPAEAQSLD